MTHEQFEILYRRHYRQILGFCRKCTHDRHQAEDLAGSTFLSLLEKIESIRFETGENYLAISARNKVVDFQRRQKFIKSALQNIPELIENTWGLEDFQHLEISVDHLPEMMKKGIVLQYIYGYSREEVAQMINKSPNTIRNNTAAGLSKLRKSFAL